MPLYFGVQYVFKDRCCLRCFKTTKLYPLIYAQKWIRACETIQNHNIILNRFRNLPDWLRYTQTCGGNGGHTWSTKKYNNNNNFSISFFRNIQSVFTVFTVAFARRTPKNCFKKKNVHDFTSENLRERRSCLLTNDSLPPILYYYNRLPSRYRGKSKRKIFRFFSPTFVKHFP